MRSLTSGFTLMELIITILVMAILLGIGVPSYMRFKEDNLLLGAAQALYADIQFARSEAIKRNTDITIHFFTDDSDNARWCYRISDNASCEDACTSDCDSACDAACDIHGDGVARGASSADYPNVNFSHSAASNAVSIQSRRRSIDPDTMTFTYGSTTKQVSVQTDALGHVYMCTPSGATGLTGVEQCTH